MTEPNTIHHYRGIITKRHGAVTGTPPRGDPAQITYDFIVTDPGVALKGVNTMPTRRISVGAKVIPAEENDPCWIVVVNKKLFLHVIEGLPFVEACP